MSEISEALERFCARLSTGQHLPQQRFVHDALRGIAGGKSLMLSEMARSLNEPLDIERTFQRLSRNLNSNRLDDHALMRSYLEQVSPLVQRPGTVIAVDYTDLSKPRARPWRTRGMEGVCTCWDGSKHQKGKGFPIAQIEASMANGPHFPLAYEPFSFTMPGFVSQNSVFLEQIAKVAPYVSPEAWWTFDRGFEGRGFFDSLDELGLRWICRLKATAPSKKRDTQRHLFTEDGNRTTVREIAMEVDTPVKHGQSEIGSCRVRLADVKSNKAKAVGEWRTLVVVWLRDLPDPICLLVSEGVDNVAEIADAYLRRWKAEEGNRSMKANRWGLEMENSVRALKFRGVQRLCRFAAMVYGFLALISGTAVARAAMSIVRVFACNTTFDHRYRLLRGVSRWLGLAARAPP